ncbi:MAG TPA: hypothetical protein VIR01_09020 [Pyrinomonadaceae bacterium]|jgi:hypothetical protein
MTASMYRKHTLFSRPYYDDELEGWMPYASVVQDFFIDGDQNNFYYHEMKNLNQRFETEEQALCFGFISGRCWIDEHLSHAAVKSKAVYARCAVLLLLSMQLPDLAIRDIEDRSEALRARIKELLAS